MARKHRYIVTDNGRPCWRASSTLVATNGRKPVAVFETRAKAAREIRRSEDECAMFDMPPRTYAILRLETSDAR